MSPTSIFSRENVRIGSTYFCWNDVNAPAAFGGSSSLQTWARKPEAIEPPETLDIRAARDRTPSSFRRTSAPAWNSMARNPPPESAMPMPGSSEWPSQLKPFACSVTPLGELGRGSLMTVFSHGRGRRVLATMPMHPQWQRSSQIADRRRKLSPYPSRNFAHPLELTFLVIDGKVISSDRRGKAALSAERQSFQGHKAVCL